MFDPLLHQPIRTQLIATLVNNEAMSFKMLKESLDLSDGNLSTHMKKLVEAGYIDESKFFEGKRPKTVYTISKKGLEAFREYVQTLEHFLQKTT